MISIVQDKIANGNSSWFRDFTKARKSVEEFLIVNKSIIGMILQNLAKSQRIPKVQALLEYLVSQFKDAKQVTIEGAIKELGLTGRIVDVRGMHLGPEITDEAKASAFLKQAMKSVMCCPICGGYLDPKKSSTWDHIVRVREGGTGDQENLQLVHPYCNDGDKN